MLKQHCLIPVAHVGEGVCDCLMQILNVLLQRAVRAVHGKILQKYLLQQCAILHVHPGADTGIRKSEERALIEK